MKNIQDSITSAKEALPDITPTPPGMKAQSSVHDLKARLEWGEPGLTIIDVRDRSVYNQGHIMGAMPMPVDELVDRVKSALPLTRDIYIYGEADEETAEAAQKLRKAGFQSVAELRGGLPAWKAIAGPTEGSVEAVTPPGPEGYNLVSQVSHHADTQQSNP
ncbi:MAG: rhodanese-like domain-containing protein [Leptolyngbyaceae bacterium]|nr:rhodanese-like domain-containing protein [Leptolyngbyaceae bacterium]